MHWYAEATVGVTTLAFCWLLCTTTQHASTQRYIYVFGYEYVVEFRGQRTTKVGHSALLTFRIDMHYGAGQAVTCCC
jgi:hypothetical protein